MKYYHVSSQLEVGARIIPCKKTFMGWSSFSDKTTITNEQEFYDCLEFLKKSPVYRDTDRTPEKWVCEILFENIRKNYFFDHPSRIYGTYLCQSVTEAIRFKQKYRNADSKIFEVEIEDNVNYYDMQLFTIAESSIYGSSFQNSVYNTCIKLAYDYWNSQGNSSISEKEYLYDKEIVVGKEIST